ncbi:MAG: alpha/beta hydrolase, partial [Nocardioides sp.]|nr:alpha/beta hydrolase [Nocardioides sp.]
MVDGGWALVERPDARIWYFETTTDAPVVVLLHGLAGHAREWSRTIDALDGEHKVVAVEQRGHGGSTRRPDDVSRQAHVDDVAAVLNDLHTDDVVLVGQSMGAHTAMLVAAHYPRLVDRLVMVEGGLGGEGPAGVAAVHEWLRDW